jgi:hypothetical protein
MIYFPAGRDKLYNQQLSIIFATGCASNPLFLLNLRPDLQGGKMTKYSDGVSPGTLI